MSDEIKLKPCPFCGGKAEIVQYGDNRKSTIIECGECACRLENGETFRHGTIWNTRTDTLPTWQPIETAPRDGTPFIAIGIIGGAPVVCWWKTEEVRESLGEEDDSEFPWAFLEDDGILNGCKEDEHGPTHWMPLPTPPKRDTHD